MSKEYFALSNTPGDLDQLIQNIDYENQQFVKLIEQENIQIEVCKQCNSRRMHVVPELEKDIAAKQNSCSELQQETCKLDEETKRAHQQFTINRDRCNSLKKTGKMLSEHKAVLDKRLEHIKSEEEKMRLEQTEVVGHYNRIWEDYKEKYESFPLAKDLRSKHHVLQRLSEMIDTAKEKAETLKAEMKKARRVEDVNIFDLTQYMVKLAELRTEIKRQQDEWCSVSDELMAARRNVEILAAKKSDLEQKFTQHGKIPSEERQETAIPLSNTCSDFRIGESLEGQVFDNRRQTGQEDAITNTENERMVQEQIRVKEQTDQQYAGRRDDILSERVDQSDETGISLEGLQSIQECQQSDDSGGNRRDYFAQGNSKPMYVDNPQSGENLQLQSHQSPYACQEKQLVEHQIKNQPAVAQSSWYFSNQGNDARMMSRSSRQFVSIPTRPSQYSRQIELGLGKSNSEKEMPDNGQYVRYPRAPVKGGDMNQKGDIDRQFKGQEILQNNNLKQINMKFFSANQDQTATQTVNAYNENINSQGVHEAMISEGQRARVNIPCEGQIGKEQLMTDMKQDAYLLNKEMQDLGSSRRSQVHIPQRVLFNLDQSGRCQGQVRQPNVASQGVVRIQEDNQRNIISPEKDQCIQRQRISQIQLQKQRGLLGQEQHEDMPEQRVIQGGMKRQRSTICPENVVCKKSVGQGCHGGVNASGDGKLHGVSVNGLDNPDLMSRSKLVDIGRSKTSKMDNAVESVRTAGEKPGVKTATTDTSAISTGLPGGAKQGSGVGGNTESGRDNREVRQGETQTQTGDTELRLGDKALKVRDMDLQQCDTEVIQHDKELKDRDMELRQSDTELLQGDSQLQQGNKELQQDHTVESSRCIISDTHAVSSEQRTEAWVMEHDTVGQDDVADDSTDADGSTFLNKTPNRPTKQCDAARTPVSMFTMEKHMAALKLLHKSPVMPGMQQRPMFTIRMEDEKAGSGHDFGEGQNWMSSFFIPMGGGQVEAGDNGKDNDPAAGDVGAKFGTAPSDGSACGTEDDKHSLTTAGVSVPESKKIREGDGVSFHMGAMSDGNDGPGSPIFSMFGDAPDDAGDTNGNASFSFAFGCNEPKSPPSTAFNLF